MYNDTKYSNTPRGAQDKQLLALTQSELPWTPADYKTRSNANKPVSIVWDLLGVTPTICNKINDNEYNKVNSYSIRIDPTGFRHHFT